MNDIDFASFLVSRVCHDLVGPMGAVVNGLEVLEDERDAAMRADAIKIVTQSANQALARLQFLRIAFGAAGSAGAELDLGEVGRLVSGLLEGTKVKLEWQSARINWPKDWAKLLMNATMLAADCLPRGGQVVVETSAADAAKPSFTIHASGSHAKIMDEVEKAIRGEASHGPVDARGIQPFLTYKIAHSLNASLTLSAREGGVDIAAG
jgi:histidine phosphotransferase ChpT